MADIKPFVIFQVSVEFCWTRDINILEPAQVSQVIKRFKLLKSVKVSS